MVLKLNGRMLNLEKRLVEIMTRDIPPSQKKLGIRFQDLTPGTWIRLSLHGLDSLIDAEIIKEVLEDKADTGSSGGYWVFLPSPLVKSVIKLSLRDMANLPVFKLKLQQFTPFPIYYHEIIDTVQYPTLYQI